MSERQKTKYIITLASDAETLAVHNLSQLNRFVPDCTVNGRTIETIGNRNMKAITDLFANCRLKVQFVQPQGPQMPPAGIVSEIANSIGRNKARTGGEKP